MIERASNHAIGIKERRISNIDGRPILYLNPGHGNEPYILATAIGREVSKKFADAGMIQPLLVVPLLYGERQKKILLEENPNDKELIHYDEEAGNILRNVIFGSGDFNAHLTQVNRHYDDVDAMLNQRYARSGEPIATRSLATDKTVELSPKNIIGAIDVGNRVSVKIPHRYFAFPELLSRVLHESMQHPELGFSESDMRKLANRMIKVEESYSQAFVPWINPFSYQYASDLSKQPTAIDGRSRIYTPAMKTDMPATQGLVEPGVYIMFSGTDSAVEANKALIKAAKEAGIKAYAPPWEKIEGAEPMSPSIMSDSNISAIGGRSGWGTGWQSMQLEKPWLVPSYQPGDDPEIYYNNKTNAALHLGRIIGKEGISGAELSHMAQTISPGLHKLKNAIREQFGTTDGIDYIANSIFKDLASAT